MPSPKELAKALAYQGEIRNTPQNSFLGGIANFLAPVSEFADRDKLPESIPLLGGMSFADLSGLKGSQSLIEDMSYGKSPVRGATLNTVKVDPRLLDLAAVSGAMIPVGKALGKAALKKAAEQVQNRIGIARYMPDTRMGVVPEGASMPQRPKTEFEILHDTAQRNAALPKEQGGLGLPSGNTAMDRAGAMGFDTPAYHGTTTEIDPSFNLDYSGANALDYGKKNIWATDNPELASQYAEAGLSRNQAEAIQKLGDFNWTKKEEIPDKIADAMFKDIAEYGSIEGGGANVLPLLLRGKQSVHESYGGRFKNEMPKALWGRDLENADIAVIKNVIDNPTLQKVDPSTVYAIKNPANIRSRFAAFDPMRRHEADILAGVGVGGMLDPQAIAEALRQQDRK